MKRAACAWLTFAFAASAITIGVGYSYSGHKWSVRQVPYYINPNNSDVSPAAAIAAIQQAASAWSMQSNADFSFYYMGQTSGSSITNNGKNEVFFRNETSGSIGQTFRYWNSAGTLVDTDIVFYDASWKFFAGYSGCSGGYYIEEIATHEFGHALGLNHSTVSTASMYPGAYTCATWKGSLDSDDIAGVEALYPPSGTDNTSPSVTVSSPGSNSSFVEGTGITFSGSASDKEDGNISVQLKWTSSRDGQLGTGVSFTRTLSVGTHTVTAQVTDTGGATGSRSVSVTVTEPVNAPPAVNINSPGNNTSYVQGTVVSFSGSATDTEDGNLSSGLKWSSNIDGPLSVGSSFSRALSAGTHTITAQVSDSAGTTSSKSVLVLISAPVNAAPTVTISSPSNSSSFVEGAGITFSGSATDTEDGSLSSKMTWRSTIDGPLGMGSSFTRTLSSGSHTVTAEVSDSAGVKTSRSVAITVTSPVSSPPPPSTTLWLAAKGYKLKGNQRVDLSWTGGTTAGVDVYRNGTLVTRTSNDGAFTDAINEKGKGQYTYLVCESGTSTCSNSVSVKF